MTRALPLSVAALVLSLISLFFSSPARAELELSMNLSAREVSAGEPFEVRLDAMSSGDEMPSAPELAVPSGFEVRGPTIGTRQQVSISNFNMVRQKGISATWVVTASRPGLYTIGPATVRLSGSIEQAQPAQVRVVPAGQRPRRRPRRSLDPFDSLDPLGKGFDDLFDRLRDGSSTFDRLPAAPANVVPDRAPDPLAFLTVSLEPKRAVVGQQVTLTIYAHGGHGIFQEAPGAREPTHPDFLAHRLVEDASRQPVYHYTLDGQRWIVVKIREIALFPLRAGELEIGPFEFGFLGRRYGFRDGQGLRRSTKALTLQVTEPPVAGRPPGYRGDVGTFTLTAQVEPRSVTAGGAVSVTARVRGSGRLPSSLNLPERAGVQWLDPTLHEDVRITASTLGGTRTFSYVVRLEEAGTLDLGSLKLPYYDPAERRYQVAEASLGSVVVQPSEAAALPDPPPPQGSTLYQLVEWRGVLRRAPAPLRLADRIWFWWLVGGAPICVLGAAGGIALLRRLRRRWSEREDSPAMHARRALTEARAGLARDDRAAVASATERALYHGIEWSTGLKARALLRSELTSTLEARGLPPALAARSVELLDRSAALRRGTLPPSDAAAVVAEADALVKELTRRARRAAEVATIQSEVRA